MTTDPQKDEQRQIQHVRDDLVRDFPHLSPDVVAQEVGHVVQAFVSAPVRSFVPVLVRRGARERLRQLV